MVKQGRHCCHHGYTPGGIALHSISCTYLLIYYALLDWVGRTFADNSLHFGWPYAALHCPLLLLELLDHADLSMLCFRRIAWRLERMVAFVLDVHRRVD